MTPSPARPRLRTALRVGLLSCALALTGTPAVAVDAPPISQTWQTGKVTYYGSAGLGGNCSPSSVPSSKYTVAVGPIAYANGAACGTYVTIKGAKGTIRAKVDNLCPECGPDHLDLSTEAFLALDDLSKGIAPVSFRGVKNPGVGQLTTQIKSGSSQWWFAVRIDSHGNALKSVEISSAGGPFKPLALQMYGYWLDAAGPGPAPYTIRITDVEGHVATIPNLALTPGPVVMSKVWLYGPKAIVRATPL